MKNYLKYLTLALITAFIPVSVSEGKGGSSGFSSSRSSSSSSRSSSGFSSSKSSSAPKSTPSKPSSGFSSSSGKSTASTGSSSASRKSAFDIAQQRKSIAPPKPKNDYVNEFKSKNASKYPTTFESKPAVRPSYIPQSTTYNGASRNIEYNPTTRSYGFMDGLGQFMIYDAITDMASNAFDNDQKVYIQQVEKLDADHAAAVAQEKETSGWWIFGIIMVVILVAIGVVYWMSL